MDIKINQHHRLLTCLFRKIWVDRVTQKIVAIEVNRRFHDVFQEKITLELPGRLFVEPDEEQDIIFDFGGGKSVNEDGEVKRFVEVVYKRCYGQLAFW